MLVGFRVKGPATAATFDAAIVRLVGLVGGWRISVCMRLLSLESGVVTAVLRENYIWLDKNPVVKAPEQKMQAVLQD